jgi:hypothetical protein
LESIDKIVADLRARRDTEVCGEEVADHEGESTDDKPPQAIRILGCPACDRGDRIALEMLETLLKKDRWQVELTAPDTLTAELLEQVAEKKPPLICIAAIPPGGVAHARYLCKRLRARFPDLRIIVCSWGRRTRRRSNPVRLFGAGAETVTTTLLETRRQLASLFPVIAHAEAVRDTASRASSGSTRGSEELNGSERSRRVRDREIAARLASS